MLGAYEANITRDRPGCILFLLDTSASMGDPFQHGMSRAAFLTDALNRTLTELAAACKRVPDVRHYFDVGVLAYGGITVRPALAGSLADRPLVPISDLAANPKRVERRLRKEPDGAGGIIEAEVPFPIYFEAVPDGGTPMCSGLRQAASVIGGWCRDHAGSFPPIVIHITDGEATDGGPDDVEAAARGVTDQRTTDGYALLLNLHVSGAGTAIAFPTTEQALTGDPALAGRRDALRHALALYRASSTLPPPLLARCFKRGMPVQPGSRGYVYNGGMEHVIAMFDIGTKAAAERTAVTSVDR